MDSAAQESFFSTLEHELLSRRHFSTREQARRAVAGWVVGFSNRARWHPAHGMLCPLDYELAAAAAHDQAA